jgi:hypothetical protein
MKEFFFTILKILRKVYLLFHKPDKNKLICNHDADISSKLIQDMLARDEACMITRFGSTELTCLVNYLGITRYKKKYWKYIRGKTPQWWWQKSIIQQLYTWSGFFPPTQEKVEMFCKLFLEDIKQIDLLGSWLHEEKYLDSELEDVDKIFLLLLEPFWSKEPWTKVLEGKKVLVVHPFSGTIEKQFKKREILHKRKILPKFKLKTIKAVQSIAGEPTPFIDWFQALNYMKNKIDNTDYDICLIGAGAYGFPLAAHVKRTGKKAVHIGGSLQLFFGIRGKRWEVPLYEPGFDYKELITDHWVKPSKNETPNHANLVENSCYW